MNWLVLGLISAWGLAGILIVAFKDHASSGERFANLILAALCAVAAWHVWTTWPLG